MKTLQTIDEALDYLYSFINYETNSSFTYGAVHYNVERTARLLDLLRNPEKGLEIIHVAGTKGKGSVCAIIDSVLRTGGSGTGVFTSPHIEKVNERIVVNGTPVDNESFIDLLNEISPLIDTFPPDNLPTTFEILTAMAILYFNRNSVRYCILETGMGGRFDSTNFCDPIVAVITSISYDHMDKLGETIEQIASEKAGIIKPGRPVVVGYQPYDVENIFKHTAGKLKSPLFSVPALCRYEIHEKSDRGVSFQADVDGLTFSDLFISLSGRHQVENTLAALLSLKVVDLLPEHQSVKESLAAVRIPVRLEFVQWCGRRFILDSAHNADSARVLAEALKTCYIFERLVAVVGIVKGKDIRGILKHISSVADRLVITQPVTHKELDIEAVYENARRFIPDTILIRDIEKALQDTVKATSERDIILITGSFYTVSPAREVLFSENKG